MQSYIVGLALVTACAPALGQNADHDFRERVFGRATTVDGKAWKHAKVTLIGRAFPAYWHAGEADEVTATTDERGRFEARILSHRRYSSWAHSEHRDGGYRLSRIHDHIVPGVPVRLRERASRQPAIRLRVEGVAAAAKALGPLEFWLKTRAPSNVLVRKIKLDANGVCELPPIPARYVLFEVVSSPGVRHWLEAVPTSAAARKTWKDRTSAHRFAKGEPGVSILRIPPPSTVTFEVTSRAPLLLEGAGSKIEGAKIHVGAADSAGSISDIYETSLFEMANEKGIVDVPLLLSWTKAGRRQDHPSIWVTAPACAGTFFRHGSALGDGRKDLAPGAKAKIQLKPGHAVRGRLMLDTKTAAAAIKVLAYQEQFSGSGGTWTGGRPFVYTTNERGDFEIEGLNLERGYRITALVPPNAKGVREECYLAYRAPKVLNRRQAAAIRNSKDVELGTIELSELARVEVSVLGPDGRPADRARVLLGETDRQRPPRSVTYWTDRRGKLTFRSKEPKLAVFASHESGFALAQLAVQAGGKPTKLALQLEAATYISGVAVDDKGQPVANARIWARCSGHERIGAWRGPVISCVCRSSLELSYRRSVTDDKGRFRIPFPQTGLEVNVRAWRYVDGLPRLGMRKDLPSFKLGKEPRTDLRLVLRPSER